MLRLHECSKETSKAHYMQKLMNLLRCMIIWLLVQTLEMLQLQCLSDTQVLESVDCGKGG